jgi:hypothetical protein
MPRRDPPLTKAAQKRALKRVHEDPQIARELIGMGIFRPDTGGRLHYGQCHAWAKSRGRQCQRKAYENGVCPNHGAFSTGPRTARGKARWKAKVKASWKRWRLENGYPEQSWRERKAAKQRGATVL